MYSLYKKKKPSSTDDRTASNRHTSNTPPVSVQSATGSFGSSRQRHHQEEQHQYQHSHSGYPHPIAEENANNLDVPKGPLDPSSEQPRRVSRCPESTDQESKQKDDQMVRRMLRRRGFEDDSDDTNDYMLRPMRPSRMSCLRCTQDIGYHHHQISCNSEKEKHLFCRDCVVRYVDAWVNGEAQYELRQGSRVGRSKTLFALPCMSPACQFGCFPEASLQPLLTHAMFTGCRQKLVKARAEHSQAMSLQQESGSSCSSDSHTVAHRRGQDMEQDTQPPQKQAPNQHFYSQLSGQRIHVGGTIAPSVVAQFQKHRREPPDYEQYQRHYHQQQQPPQQRTQEQMQEDDDELQLRQQRQQRFQDGECMQEQHWQQQQQQPITYKKTQHQDTYQQQQGATSLTQPILRRSSTASTGNTTRKNGQRVTFTCNSADEMALVDDDGDLSVVSSGSSVSSLTTRFPSSVDPRAQEREREVSEQFGRQQQHRLRHEPQYPDIEQNPALCPTVQEEAVDVALTTCQCCYEEFSPEASAIICCDPRVPNEPAHHFCSNCVRTYVEEWIFGAATYSPRPGRPDCQGGSLLILPCLHGDCAEGGFPDEQVSQILTSKSMEQYRSKMYTLRVQKQDDEEHLVQMAIRLSLEHEQTQMHVAELYREQASLTKDGLDIYPPIPVPRDQHPRSTLNVPYTTLSTISSLTSFQTFLPSSKSLPDFPSDSIPTNNVTSHGNLHQKCAKHPSSSALRQDAKREQSLHSVEEAMTLAKVRTCPHCMTKFLKDEDFCNKLKCPSCKTAICYVCREVIPTHGYAHFCTHKQGGCIACLGTSCPLWTRVEDDNRRDLAEMRARGLDEANRIWEESLLSDHSHRIEICVDVDSLLQQPTDSTHSHGR
jgi:hypothetical protein